MDIYSCPARAKEQLSRTTSYSTKKLVLLHTGVLLGVGLLLSVFSYLLSLGIGNTGGLNGIGDRAVLETIQSVLQVLNTMLMPFWQIGLLAASLCIVKEQSFSPYTLLEGFRRFGPVLRLYLLRSVIAFFVVMLATQIASTVFMLTPWAQELYVLAEQMAASGVTDVNAVLTDEILLSLGIKMLPFLLGALLLLLIPVLYRLRMMEYVLLDHPGLGAFGALRLSLFMTRKNCWKLFRLDLKFWWFYVLEMLAMAICYGDLLLSLAGIPMAGAPELWSLGFYAAGLLCQLGLYVWKKDLLITTYALAYQELLPPPPPVEG